MKGNSCKYQLVMVLNPRLEESPRGEVVKKVEKWAGDFGVKVDKQERLGTKELIYKIKGFERGDFWIFDLGGSKPLKLKDFNIFLNREVGIIRYLVLKETKCQADV